MPELDSSQYLAWAGWIADGHHAWPQPTIQGPAYPYFLAALMSLTGGFARRGRRVAGRAGRPLVRHHGRARIAVVWHEGGSRRGAPPGRAGTARVRRDVALLRRPAHLLHAVVDVRLHDEACDRVGGSSPRACSWVRRRSSARPRSCCCRSTSASSPSMRRRGACGGVAVGALAAGTACLVVFVAARNASDPFGSFQLQGFAGLNFYIGNSPAGSGTATVRLGAGWENLWGEASRAGLTSPASQDRYYVRKTFGEIAGDPWGFVRAARLESDVVRSGRRESGTA